MWWPRWSRPSRSCCGGSRSSTARRNRQALLSGTRTSVHPRFATEAPFRGGGSSCSLLSHAVPACLHCRSRALLLRPAVLLRRGIGRRTLDRCQKDSRRDQIHTLRSKIIDVESNAAQKDASTTSPTRIEFAVRPADARLRPRGRLTSRLSSRLPCISASI